MTEAIKLFFAKTFFYLFGYLPLPVLHWLGTGIGLLLYLLPIKLNYYLKRNIELCFPNLSPREAAKLAKQAAIEQGKSVMEAPVFWVRTERYLNRLIKQVDGFAQLQQDYAKQAGVIMLGCHMGGYYLGNAFLAPRFSDAVWIYKPQRGMVEQLIKHMRAQFGGEFVTASIEGVRKIYRTLREGKLVGMSCDHNTLDFGSVFVPYFGIPVPTMTLGVRLAAKSQAAVYFMFLQRLPRARGYHLHLQKLTGDVYNEDPAIAAGAMNQVLEQTLRQYPAQGEWFYRRFWDRPPGEPPLYKTQ